MLWNVGDILNGNKEVIVIVIIAAVIAAAKMLSERKETPAEGEVHAPPVQGDTPTSSPEHTHRRLRDAGIVVFSLAILGSGGWFAYRIVDGLSTPQHVKLARQLLSQSEAFGLLAEREPGFRSALEARMKSLGSSRLDFNVGFQIGGQIADPYIDKYLSTTSDACLVEFYQCILRIARHLRSKNPTAALAYLMNWSDYRYNAADFSGLDAKEFDRVLLRVLRTTDNGPAAFDKTRAEALYAEFSEREILSRGDRFNSFLDRVCAGDRCRDDPSYASSVAIDYFAALLGEGPNSAILLRFLFSIGT